MGLWKSRISVLFENCVLGRPPIEFRLNQLENKAQSRATQEQLIQSQMFFSPLVNGNFSLQTFVGFFLYHAVICYYLIGHPVTVLNVEHKRV